jgi:hypothetical protein
MACAAIVACVGDDPVLATEAADGGREGAAPADAATAPEGAAADATPGPGPCGARDTTPCGCGGGKSCCIGGDVVGCYPVGQEDQADAAAGCTSTTTLRCLATTCGANRACCFNGDVNAGDACGKRLTAFDTACVDVSATAVDPYPCVDETNGNRKALTCLVDGDCTKFDAGTCVSGLMDKADRVIGVCVR